MTGDRGLRLSVQRRAGYGEPVQSTSFGRYRVVELLGRADIGEVWRAHDTATNQMVAIKLLPPRLAAENSAERRTNPAPSLQESCKTSAATCAMTGHNDC